MTEPETDKQLDAVFQKAVWEQFTCNYGEKNWPKIDPYHFLVRFYNDGCYDKKTGEEIIIWKPFEDLSLRELLTEMDSFEKLLRSISEEYYRIKLAAKEK